MLIFLEAVSSLMYVCGLRIRPQLSEVFGRARCSDRRALFTDIMAFVVESLVSKNFSRNNRLEHGRHLNTLNTSRIKKDSLMLTSRLLLFGQFERVLFTDSQVHNFRSKFCLRK